MSQVANDSLLRVTGVSKRFGGFAALTGVSIAVALVLIAVAGGLLALTRAPGVHDKIPHRG